MISRAFNLTIMIHGTHEITVLNIFTNLKEVLKDKLIR